MAELAIISIGMGSFSSPISGANVVISLDNKLLEANTNDDYFALKVHTTNKYAR